MTTSSTDKSNSKTNHPSLQGDHWADLISLLDFDNSTDFSDWLEKDLKDLESKLSQFSSAAAIKKSLRR